MILQTQKLPEKLNVSHCNCKDFIPFQSNQGDGCKDISGCGKPFCSYVCHFYPPIRVTDALTRNCSRSPSEMTLSTLWTPQSSAMTQALIVFHPPPAANSSCTFPWNMKLAFVSCKSPSSQLYLAATAQHWHRLLYRSQSLLVLLPPPQKSHLVIEEACTTCSTCFLHIIRPFITFPSCQSSLSVNFES